MRRLATSHVLLARLPLETGRADRLVGLRLFAEDNDVKVVEVARTVATSPEVHERVSAWLRGAGNHDMRWASYTASVGLEPSPAHSAIGQSDDDVGAAVPSQPRLLAIGRVDRRV